MYNYNTKKKLCIICKKNDVNHIEVDCPERCTICRGYHKTINHPNESNNRIKSYLIVKQGDIGLSALGTK